MTYVLEGGALLNLYTFGGISVPFLGYLLHKYFIMVMAGEGIGIAFLFYVPAGYAHFVGLLWGVFSMACGIAIHRLTKTPLKGYNVEITGPTQNAVTRN